MVKYISLLLCVFVFGASNTLGSHAVELDLLGNGTKQSVALPYPYFTKKENDFFKFVSQGGCHIATIGDVNKVIMMGACQPCVAVSVSDGNTAAFFHVHSTNSHKGMIKILREAFPDSLPQTVAHIFSAADNIEWDQQGRTRMHAGKSHEQAIDEIKNSLISASIPQDSIQTLIYNKRDTHGQLKYKNWDLGRYATAEVCVAVRMDTLFSQKDPRTIPYFSIDPLHEDIFGFSGSYLSMGEIDMYSVAKPTQKTQTTSHTIPYDALPQIFQSCNNQDTSGLGAGVFMQRNITLAYAEDLKNTRYETVFKKSVNELMKTSPYQSLNFFKIR